MLNNDVEMVLYKGRKIKTPEIKKRDLLHSNKILVALNNTAKRCTDISCGIIGIMILIPITFIVILLKVIYRDKGPLFYTQDRIGKNGKLFKMYKFRTMKIGADEELERILASDEEARKEYQINKKLKNDPRITKYGKFLRKTSLDEFPQFVNVLKGDMSLVGPRPYLPREQEDMGNYYFYICKCKPGITGLWQTSGRSEVSFEERLDLDLQYYKDENVFFDLGLVAKTVVQTLKREGAM